MTESLYQTIYRMVELVPYGKVATYGQIAALVGRPRHARQVGYALAALSNEGADDDHQVPWHRIINAKGEVSTRAHPDYEDYQRILLEDEGIEFGLHSRVSLKLYQWNPDE